MDALDKHTQAGKRHGRLAFGMSVAKLSAVALALVWLAVGSAHVASAGPLSQATATPVQTGCQFSILEFKDCIRGNCAEYEIPLQNTANQPVTVNGFVEFQGPNNVVLATQPLPETTVPARSTITVKGSVCVQGNLPPGPYQFRVVIQDIPRACERKEKSQPLDYCEGAQPTPGTATPTSTPPGGTPLPITPQPTATATATATTPPGGTPLPTTPQPTATTPAGGTPAPATPQPTATEEVGGAFTPEPVPTIGPTPGGMPRTGSGSSQGMNGLEIIIPALAVTLLIAGIMAQRRRSSRVAPGA